MLVPGFRKRDLIWENRLCRRDKVQDVRWGDYPALYEWVLLAVPCLLRRVKQTEKRTQHACQAEIGLVLPQANAAATGSWKEQETVAPEGVGSCRQLVFGPVILMVEFWSLLP